MLFFHFLVFSIPAAFSMDGYCCQYLSVYNTTSFPCCRVILGSSCTSYKYHFSHINWFLSMQHNFPFYFSLTFQNHLNSSHLSLLVLFPSIAWLPLHGIRKSCTRADEDKLPNFSVYVCMGLHIHKYIVLEGYVKAFSFKKAL